MTGLEINDFSSPDEVRTPDPTSGRSDLRQGVSASSSGASAGDGPLVAPERAGLVVVTSITPRARRSGIQSAASLT